MGYARHVGRIGALALALGIGGVVAPQVASAQTPGNSSTPSASPTESNVSQDDGPTTDTPTNTDEDTSGDLATDVGDEDPEDKDGDGLDADAENVDDEDLDSDNDNDVDDVALADDVDKDEYGDDDTEATDELDTETDDTSSDFAVINNTTVAQRNSAPEALDTNQIDAADTPTTTTTATLDVPSPETVIDVVFRFVYAPAPPSKAPLAVLLWTLLAPVRTLMWTALAVTNNISRATGDSFTVAGDDPRTFTAAELTGNDLSPRGRPLSIYSVGDAVNGTVVLNADGTVTFTPTPGSTGTARFAYRPQDHFGIIGTKTAVTLKVDHAPVIESVSASPQIGNTWRVSVDTSDVDEDPVTVTVTGEGLRVTRSSDGTFQVIDTNPFAAADYPGRIVTVTVTATAGGASTATTTPIGTVNNTMIVGHLPYGQNEIPALPVTVLADGTAKAVVYTKAVSGDGHTILLRSDGAAIAVGRNDFGQTNIPTLPDSVTYTDVAAWTYNTILVRSDGTAIGLGANVAQIHIPALPAGVFYTGAAMGPFHSMLLRSDGTAIGVGSNSYGQLNVPVLPDGVTYTQAAVGTAHTMLLRSDGTVVAFGANLGQKTIPPLPEGLTYTGVTSGDDYTVLLRSDGAAISVGAKLDGRTYIPAPPHGVTYIHAVTNGYQTVLFRSDGTAVGDHDGGWAILRPLGTGVRYRDAALSFSDKVMLTGV